MTYFRVGKVASFTAGCQTPINTTVADLGIFYRETVLVLLEGSSVKISGPNKTVKIDESKFGRRKYHRGYPVKG